MVFSCKKITPCSVSRHCCASRVGSDSGFWQQTNPSPLTSQAFGTSRWSLRCRMPLWCHCWWSKSSRSTSVSTAHRLRSGEPRCRFPSKGWGAWGGEQTKEQAGRRRVLVRQPALPYSTVRQPLHSSFYNNPSHTTVERLRMSPNIPEWRVPHIMPVWPRI